MRPQGGVHTRAAVAPATVRMRELHPVCPDTDLSNREPI
jgi:hypothetical protein